MITCTVCQHSNIDGVMFCEKCGHELGSETEISDPVTPSLATEPAISVNLSIPDPLEGISKTTENIYTTTEDFSQPLVSPTNPSSKLINAKLTAKSAESPTQEFILDENPLIVGKFDPDTGQVEIDLLNFPNSDLISRNHSELSFDGKNWQVTDLNSTNGTWLKRGTDRPFKITQTETLSEGDRLSFANIVFTFSLIPEIS